MTMQHALLSVSDKNGLIDFARGLIDAGVELIASGGTAQALRDAGLAVSSVEEYTGLPSVLDGRVKTLHPAIHGGILARDTDDHRVTLTEQGWHTLDIVVVNLYPFVETIAREGVTFEEAIAQIDIGGVALLRAAAKNHERVTVIAEPADYDAVQDEIREHGNTTPQTRLWLARKAFAQTAAYDAAITHYLTQDSDGLPDALSLSLPPTLTLRYGENPHQQAALYAPPGVGPLGGELLQGKPLSYNNLLDLDAAWACAADFDESAVVIVKHLSPCGIAYGETQAATFKAALACDPISAFGSVIATNRPFDGATAKTLGDLFVEAIAAPAFSQQARAILSERKNCRLLSMGNLLPSPYSLRSVRGGMLLQTPDMGDDGAQWEVVTERQPSEAEMVALRLAWQAAAHVKSNAIVLAQGTATVGIGGGLPSRVDAVNLAVAKAGDAAQGSALASDAFFPFDDGPRAAAEGGVTAIVQPGGSVRDQEVIAAANELGLAMCFTRVRHFRH